MAKVVSTNKNVKVYNKGGAPAGFFLMTYLGTLVYFLDKAEGLWEVILSFLQALIWPALLVHQIFETLRI